MALSIRGAIATPTASGPCSSSRHLKASILLRDRCSFVGNRSFLQSLIKVQNGNKINRDMVVNGGETGAPLPSDPSGTSWKLWLVGMLLSVVIPFWKNKWWPLLKLKEQVSTALDTVEDVAEMVEKVAEEVGKVADDIADHLPEGKLQKAARTLENVANEAAKGAALADDLLEKIDEVEKQVDGIIDQANKKIEATDDVHTENETVKLKDNATEIKNKITQIKEENDVKNETKVNDVKNETIKP